MIVFVVPGPPVAKGRPRFGRSRSGAPVTYTDAKTAAWEDTVAWYARGAAQGQRWESEPIVVDVVAVLARPKRLLRRGDPDGEIAAPVKPDVDNLVKAVLDGLNRSGVWGDDGQVVRLVASKRYAAKGAGPETRVRVDVA